MKHLIIIIVILVIVLSCVLTEQHVINSIFDELYLQSTNCLEQIETENAIENLEKLNGWWEKKRRVLYGVISHNDIKDIDFRFPLIIEYLKRGNVEDGAAELRAMILLSQTVPSTYRFAIENIL
ncbi:MAG: DUF4363 family protein [Clostridia bacterium]|nr:DUF4363 family protein [Clostridia bacterium]MBR2323727.1 DUF4363 family protein [Clostridia bacterium]